MSNEQRKQGWTGFQIKSWTDILTHPLFSEIDMSILDYEWITKEEDPDLFSQARSKLY